MSAPSPRPILNASAGSGPATYPPSLNISHHIRFIRADHVEVQTILEPDARLTPDSILVLNAGVHVVSEAEYARQLTAAFTWLRSTHPAVTVIWRSSVPGHAHCDEEWNQLPLTTWQYNNLYHRDQMLHDSDPEWGWKNVTRLNSIAREILISLDGAVINGSSSTVMARNSTEWMTAEEVSRCVVNPDVSRCMMRFGGVYLMDVYPFDRLRPDAHRIKENDCLHQCLPGPVDTWNRVLYNFLLGLAT